LEDELSDQKQYEEHEEEEEEDKEEGEEIGFGYDDEPMEDNGNQKKLETPKSTKKPPVATKEEDTGFLDFDGIDDDHAGSKDRESNNEMQEEDVNIEIDDVLDEED